MYLRAHTAVKYLQSMVLPLTAEIQTLSELPELMPSEVPQYHKEAGQWLTFFA